MCGSNNYGLYFYNSEDVYRVGCFYINDDEHFFDRYVYKIPF